MGADIIHIFCNWNVICLCKAKHHLPPFEKIKPSRYDHRGTHLSIKARLLFLTFNTVDGVDIFIRPVYKQIIVHSLNYFIDNKGLNVYAWCLMTNHLHLLVQARENSVIAEIEKEYKAFTTKKILQDIDTEPDIRKKWMMNHFENFGKIFGFLKKFHVGQTSSSPVFIDLNKKDTLTDYVEFIHANPVRDRIVIPLLITCIVRQEIIQV